VFTDSYTNATFADKNVGTSKTVSLSGISISGADAANYTFNTTATTTANISARSLTVTATGVNKVYDGTTSASVTLSDNRVAGDSLTDSYTSASFADKNVGTGKTVSVTGISISGGDAGNYSLQNTTVTTTANITQASLIITADNKTMLLNASLTAFTVSYSGFVNSEGPGVLGGSLSCSAGTNGTAVGTFTISCNGQTSSNYMIIYKTGTLTVKYEIGGICDGDAGHQILQPINADGSSVFNGKSTSPAKFRVCDANGVSISTAGVVSNFYVSQIIAGTVTTAVNETVISTTPDTMFRWDPTGQQWIFNISNKGMTTNQTYVFVITLNDSSTIMFRYGLR
jgi:YDG domain/MBG domain (YGX type)